MSKKLHKAEYKGELKVGDLSIPCFVLDDGRRVISGRGLTAAIGMKGRGQGVARISGHKTLKPFYNNELSVAIDNPIRFMGGSPKVDTPSDGYEATVLQELCDAILSARDSGVLNTEQELRYAQCADLLIRAFARVGIIALVDEATGYQNVRARQALEKILDEFISNELRKWAKTFPDDFYREMFRLKGWSYAPFSVKRPGVVGRYTNDLIYDRLAPGVLNELKQVNPSSKGQRKNKHHQWLTEDVGHPRLREHLAAVIALMRASSNWETFKRLIERSFPKIGANLEIPLDDLNELHKQ